MLPLPSAPGLSSPTLLPSKTKSCSYTDLPCMSLICRALSGSPVRCPDTPFGGPRKANMPLRRYTARLCVSVRAGICRDSARRNATPISRTERGPGPGLMYRCTGVSMRAVHEMLLAVTLACAVVLHTSSSLPPIRSRGDSAQPWARQPFYQVSFYAFSPDDQDGLQTIRRSC